MATSSPVIAINADDLGYCSERDKGILRAFEVGGVTSASLLVSGPTAESASREALENGLEMGLHLNFTEGRPVCGGEAVPSLLGSDGVTFMKKPVFWRAAANGNVSPEDVRKEALAQLHLFRKMTGRDPAHVDGHNHVHVIPIIADTLAPLLWENGIVNVRIPYEDLGLSPWIAPRSRRKYYSEVVMFASKARDVYAKCGVRSPDHFMGLGTMGSDLSLARVVARLLQVEQGSSIELMVHPGFCVSSDDADDTFRDSDWPMDDGFSHSQGREHELEMLCSTIFLETLKNDLGFEYASMGRACTVEKLQQKSGYNVALCGRFRPGTGNFVTACRLRRALEREFIVKTFDTSTGEPSAISGAAVASADAVIGIHALHAMDIALECKKQKKPVILVLGGTDCENIKVCPAAVSHSETIVAFAEHMREKVALHAPGKTVDIVHQATEVSTIAEENWLRKRAGLQEDDFLLLLTCGLRPVKDPLFLVDEILEWNSFDPKVHLVVVGPPRDSEYAEKFSNRISSAGHAITYIPPVSRSLLLRAVAESDIVINTSINEGMSCALLEAMALGVPCLARDNAGNRQLGIPLFSTPSDFKALASKVREDDAFRNATVQKAKDYIRTHASVEAEAKALNGIVCKVLRGDAQVQKLIEKFHLLAHPEGGFYRETYRSQVSVETPFGMRSASTAIDFLLTLGEVSHFHRIKSDEVWHHYKGGDILIHEISSTGEYSCTILGHECHSHVVIAGNWFASEVAHGSKWALVGCQVSPGFDFEDFELAHADELVREYPQHQLLISRLSLP